MGIYSGLVGGSSGYGDPKINTAWRDEIPQWFYENCYEVIQKVLKWEETWGENPSLHIERENKVVCHCSASGWGPDHWNTPQMFNPGKMWQVEVDLPTWERWQSILVVPFGTMPKEGDRMGHFGNRVANIWNIRSHGLCGGRFSHSELCGEGGTAREAVFHQPTSMC